MGRLKDLADELETRYLGVGGTSVGSHSSPATVERLVTIRALVNGIQVLEAIDDTTETEDPDRRLLEFYGMLAAAYNIDTALTKMAAELLGGSFASGKGIDLTEFALVRRLMAHPVDLRTTKQDRGKGLSPQGAFVGEGIWDPDTKRAGYLVTLVQEGYSWADNMYRLVFPFKYLHTLKHNLEHHYLPQLLKAVQSDQQDR